MTNFRFQILRQALVICMMAVPFMGWSQKNLVNVTPVPGKQSVNITVDGKPFTTFVYTDTMEKPFLYPIHAPGGQTITRGFPWKPEPNDPVDHPHHIGLWFNYENVNGLDFWNNSFAIAPDKKKNYGWIRTHKIEQATSGKQGKLVYAADWTDQQKNILLKERTSLEFSIINGAYVIDRETELTAAQDVTMPDVKDGMLGLRVAHVLELPVKKTTEYKDANGIATKVTATADNSVTGNYITSAGKQGDAAWGTRGNWCMLYGKKDGADISILIVDHPANPGYPTYWHARNYGLFAANPLGQKVFSEGKETLNFKLAKGEKTTFRYRVVVASGQARLDEAAIQQLVGSFAKR